MYLAYLLVWTAVYLYHHTSFCFEIIYFCFKCLKINADHCVNVDTVNIKKSEIIKVNIENQPAIEINDQNLTDKDIFTCYCSTLTLDGETNKDINKAKSLSVIVETCGSPSRSKIKLYESCMLSISSMEQNAENNWTGKGQIILIPHKLPQKDFKSLLATNNKV